MRLSLVGLKQAQPLFKFRVNMDSLGQLGFLGRSHRRREKEKVVFVIGATGTGKSKLSIDLATRFAAEIVNSDKMQVYEGLDIATNKVTEEERSLVRHHLLGVVDPDSDFTAVDFRREATRALDSVLSQGKLPIVAGGSNSYIEALVDDEKHEFRSRYQCCFLWVDVSLPVLHSFVSNRVDQMVKGGLVEEVRRMFDPEADYSRGIRRAIGVREMDRYFREENKLDQAARERVLAEAIDEIKSNTIKLSYRQLNKILRLQRLSGLNIQRLDATAVFLKQGREAEEAWEDHVIGPAAAIVNNFLINNAVARATLGFATKAPAAAMAAAATTIMAGATQ
ncbi:adenylate isopentenyltransferase 3, chloroplastic-like [Aristolochia californica]|uniref:adenylate isopentenyltransferase 3, chloroplastic-like n=1 Tax=Aristolochia californica TaxID=171875 RepID=UPI0035D82C37